MQITNSLWYTLVESIADNALENLISYKQNNCNGKLDEIHFYIFVSLNLTFHAMFIASANNNKCSF